MAHPRETLAPETLPVTDDLRRWAAAPGYVPFDVVRLENSGNPPSTDERRNVLEFYDESGNLRAPGVGICLPVSANEINSNENL